MSMNFDPTAAQPNTQDDNPAADTGTKTENVDGTTVSPQDAKRWTEFRQRIDTCKSYRKKLVRNWRLNIDYRRGKALSSQPDEDGISLNLDWSLTKSKQAALFSQIPKARISHSPESVASGPWTAAFERKMNDTIVTAGIETAMEEVLPDCINAAGIGVVMVSRETLTVNKNIPSIDLSMLPPDVHQQLLQTGKLGGQEVPMETVPQPVDTRYTIRRISPSDFLWPIDFTGSNFDNAPWLGCTGRLTWAEAKSRFKLMDGDKPSVMGEERSVEDRLSRDYERDHMADDGKVGFDEIFYHEFQFDSDSLSFATIHHLVFIHGKTKPVIDQPWEGQLINDMNGQQTIIGSTKKPIRVLTLAYVSDEDIPPSDSAIGRMQVNELNRSRSHMYKQRARTAPATWFDVNRLDPAIQQALMRGIWDHAIPVQGDGSRIIGAIQQPTLQQENYEFDRVAKADLQEMWTVGDNQQGSSGNVETKGEAQIIQSNFQTKITRERARVASFFCGIAEVLGSLMCLYEDPTTFGQGFDPSFSTKLSYSVLVDSTVLLDAQQRLQQLNNFVNTYAKSGWVNLKPVLEEIAALSGLDPSTVIVPPNPQTPPMPNISLRLTGAKDMMNPLLLAFMLKSGNAPNNQMIDQAKQLIQDSVQMPQPQQAPPGPGNPLNPPSPPPPTPGNANPQMAALPTVTGASGPGPGGPQ